jgi:Flp pilus assembly protein TadG
MFTGRRQRERGQSLTELALFLPILLMLLLGIADFARLYSAMITVESAAREAADWGSFYPSRWSTVASDYVQTTDAMRERACTAVQHLGDYEGTNGNSDCTNPTFTCELTLPGGGTQSCLTPSFCSEIFGEDPSIMPCRVTVSLTYTFNLIAPTGLVGVPPTITFTQSSTFAIADCKEQCAPE